MTSPAISNSTSSSNALSRILFAGVLTAITDGCFSSVLAAFFYSSTVARLWQGVASTLLGPSALERGPSSIAIGIAMHFCVALAWSAVFVLLISRLGFVQQLLASPGGIVKVALFYGPLIWVVMSFVVVPSLTHRPPTINVRWWIQFVGHFVFVGLPIVWGSTRR